ncbi:MAG: flagellar protein FlaG [Lachnospiraceae bacterium]|nr:flagellar protein FlaG [Lachnospiraceae bacterium]
MALERISGIGMPSYQMNTIKPVESAGTDKQIAEKDTADRNMDDAVNIDMAAAINSQDDEQSKESTDDTVGQDLNDIRKIMANTECKFGIDDSTNRITIKIIDKDTKKVIKEVPPEKTLKMIAKVWEMAGILVDEKL